MSFIESIRTVLSKYAVFNGRARLSELWWYYLAYMVAQFALLLLAVISIVATTDPQETPALAVVAMLLLFALQIGLLLPTLAVVVRRLHDTGRSGFYYFLGFIPVAGPIILLVFLAGPGTPGPNPFGLDPKAAPAVPVQV